MTTSTPLPDYEQVRTLPVILRASVPEEHEDANGHLNVTGYMALHDRAAWNWLGDLALDPRTSGRPFGIMDLEHHLRYVAELHVGDQVAVHAQLLARAERRVHGLWYIVDETAQRLANTLEFVSVHVDLEQRRAVAFDRATAEALDRQVEDGRRDWRAPVSGTMDLARPR